MSAKKIVNRRKLLVLQLFVGGLVSQLSSLALLHVASRTYHDDFGIIAFFVYIIALPLLSLAVMAVIRPPNWLALGLTAASAQLAAFFLLGSNITFDIATICFLTFGAGFIFVLAFWTDQKISIKLGRVPRFFITATFVTCIWLGMALVGTNIIGNNQASAYHKSELALLESRLGALNFKPYLPNALPSGYSIQSIIPNSESEISLPEPRSLTFVIGGEGDLKDITLVEFAVPPGFDPPKDCGPYDASSNRLVEFPLPCQQFTQAGDITIYAQNPDSFVSPKYHYYFRKVDTEITILTSKELSPKQMQNIATGLAVTSTIGLPADLLQEY